MSDDHSGQVGILVFDQVEVLDFAGPYEVFSVARRASDRRQGSTSPCPPVLLGTSTEAVTATGGMRVLPDQPLGAVSGLRALIVPGGYGVRVLMEDSAVIATLRALQPQLDVLMSVCTGAAVLARAGLLDGRSATTHKRYLDWLSELAPDCHLVRERRVVDDGNLITAAGISAGIDAALHLLARWEGQAVADETADYMEYRPPACP
ncbi:transcriptional regulator GlxA family with amidase domain [Natronospira proteinivora]|uniref:Transcriptional regulator GlxA family with amidase domain n=1 Tax=Natronospira proteinivora TaxID=1807133 RepID=A0ABT1G4P5_9GAMM|nr:DJ-1/PfpI family protein [Natronospira proteinivora]MCP1726259.1 transcriptional regulator GlxA family with amidase domain [Natronospira proteinivora]